MITISEHLGFDGLDDGGVGQIRPPSFAFLGGKIFTGSIRISDKRTGNPVPQTRLELLSTRFFKRLTVIKESSLILAETLTDQRGVASFVGIPIPPPAKDEVSRVGEFFLLTGPFRSIDNVRAVPFSTVTVEVMHTFEPEPEELKPEVKPKPGEKPGVPPEFPLAPVLIGGGILAVGALVLFLLRK